MIRTMSILANMPENTPLEGVKSNITHPHGLRSAVIIGNSVGIALMTLVYLIRVYSKRFISKQKFDWADLTLAIAVLGSAVVSILMIYDTKEGFGLHTWEIGLLKIDSANTKTFTIMEVLYEITIYFVKISLLLLFWHFFSHSISSRRLIIGGFVVSSVVMVPFLMVAILRTSDCYKTKMLTLELCRQRRIGTTNIVFGSLNILTDFYILAIPILQLRALHISTRKKIGVMATFLTGFIASSMSVARLIFIIRSINDVDFLYTTSFISLLGSVEMKLAIISGCLIYLPAFLKQSRTSFISIYDYCARSRGYGNDSSLSKGDMFLEEQPSEDKVHVLVAQRPYDELSLPDYPIEVVDPVKRPTSTGGSA